MTDPLIAWALKHHVGLDALDDLRALLITPLSHNAGGAGSENRVSSAVRLEASYRGDIVLWRNNVGALKDETGRLVRYGLANDSKAINDRIKSADLIGIYRRRIEPRDVGQVIGQFLSVETKRDGWRYAGTDREAAQCAWAAGVLAWGGVPVIHASSTARAFDNLPKGVTE